MKKFLALLIIASSFISTQVFAKTKGHYVGASILQNSVTNEYRNTSSSIAYKPDFKESNWGYGVSYKYALNSNDFFIAPELFFDNINNNTKDVLAINSRYGAKINFGYDFSDKIAIFFGTGAANVDYKINWDSINKASNNQKTSLIFAIGANYYAYKNVAINLEFNSQMLEIEAYGENLANPINQINSKINILKIGASYHF